MSEPESPIPVHDRHAQSIPPRPRVRRPEPTRPHTDPYASPVTGRDLLANRRMARLNGYARVRLHVERDALMGELDDLDDRLWQLGHHRRAILDQLDEHRDRLWPVVPDRKGRRPRSFDAPPIPPEQPDATRLWGRALRSACLGILGRLGRTSLVDLHAWLHHFGYVIASHHPVKALADAMGYETRAGRTVRCARGVYDIAPGHFPRPSRHGQGPILVDPPLAYDATEWAGAPGFIEPVGPRATSSATATDPASTAPQRSDRAPSDISKRTHAVSTARRPFGFDPRQAAAPNISQSDDERTVPARSAPHAATTGLGRTDRGPLAPTAEAQASETAHQSAAQPDHGGRARPADRWTEPDPTDWDALCDHTDPSDWDDLFDPDDLADVAELPATPPASSDEPATTPPATSTGGATPVHWAPSGAGWPVHLGGPVGGGPWTQRWRPPDATPPRPVTRLASPDESHRDRDRP